MRSRKASCQVRASSRPFEPLEGQGEKTGTPDEIREFVRKQKAAGADLIKIFASESIRKGGGMTLSQDQLNAACDEANKQGLRTLVHAYKDAVRAATLAGCTEIEHGTMATDDDLKLVAEHGTYFDPQAGLVIENYLANKERFIGTEGYTEEGFAAMERACRLDHDIVRRAAKIPGLKVVFGTDALAGSHGRNAEEFIDRVRDAGVDPMSAMVSAQLARRRSHAHGRSYRFDRTWLRSRHHRAGGRSSQRHYRGAARRFRDERRRRLQAIETLKDWPWSA